MKLLLLLLLTTTALADSPEPTPTPTPVTPAQIFAELEREGFVPPWTEPDILPGNEGRD